MKLKKCSVFSQQGFSKQALLVKVKRKRPVRRPRTRWEDYIEDLEWNRLGLQPSEMLEVVADRDVWQNGAERSFLWQYDNIMNYG